jgi:hypothetical protein
MKPRANSHALMIWSAREVLRRPGRNCLLFVCMGSLIFLIATALMFSQALQTTWNRLLDQAPDLVVRRIVSGGWAPLPAKTAVANAKSVPGVLRPTPRIWGVVPGPHGPLTVVASTGVIEPTLLQGLAPPSSGHAVVGPGVVEMLSGDQLVLGGQNKMTVTISHVFPADSGLATHDLVWMTPADTRQLLGLLPEQASDLAIHLFREQEEQAIQADLAAAFPWPVHITDRSTSKWRHRSQAVRMGGMAVAACVPAILALALIIGDTAAGSKNTQAHWGLLKSLGWRTVDIVRLQIAQASMVAIPAVITGLAAAYATLLYPPTAGLVALWLTGGQLVPSLVLGGTGTSLVLLETTVLVCLPYLTAVFLTTLKGAASDAWQLLQADPWN